MSLVNLGPPLSGFTAYFSPSGSGAWSVGKEYPNTGQVVLQMGVNGVQEQPEGIGCAAGFRKNIVAGGMGTYAFGVTVQAGPVTMLLRGAYNIFAEVRLTLSGQGVNKVARWSFPQASYVGAQFGSQRLAFTAELVQGGTYDLRIFNSIRMDYPGVPNPAPYCEIIAAYSQATMVAPGLLTEGRETEEDDPLARILARGKTHEREYTDEEMARGGAIEFDR